MAFDIKALRQQKADLVAKNSALLKVAEDANRDLTAAETTEYDSNKASIASLNARIARVEEQMDAERAIPSNSQTIEVSKPEGAKKPWASFGEQLSAIAAGTKLAERGYTSHMDPRLFAALGANESVPAEGGYLVAPEYADGILQKTYEVGEVASRCRQIPMSSNRLVMNAVDEDSRADGQRWGGILSYWEAEGQPYQGTKPKFREVQFVANKLIGLAYVTEEQLEDGPALEGYTKLAFPDEFSFQIDKAIFSGPGAGIPLGFQNSTATIVQAKDAGQATATVSASNILNMKSRLWAPSFKNAVWLIEQSVEPQLLPLLIAGTAATTAALMYTPPGMYGNNTPYGLLLGRPVIPIEQAAQLGAQGDLSLVDLSQYMLPKKTDIRADTSIHVAFLTGEVAFRFMLRLDGQPWWKKPLTPFSGAASRSPFVTLAARP
jgi:HK97 family phage major capsid protein